MAVLAVAAAAGLAYRWSDLGFEWQRFTATFRHISWPWVVLGAVFALLTYLGRALRWQVLLRPLRERSSLWHLFTATAIGFTAIVVFGRAGEVVRPYLISAREKVPFSSQVAAWFIERIYDLLTALLIFGFALSRVQNSGATVGEGLGWVLRTGGYVAAGIAALSLLLLFAFTRFSEQMRKRLLDSLTFLPQKAHERVEKIVTAFADGMKSAGKRSFVLQLAFYTLVEWALIVACYICIFRAVPDTASFVLTDVLIFVGFVSFGAVVQIPGVGGGLQVASVIVLTELFSLGLEASSGLAILIWIITFVVIVPFGFLLAFHEGLTWSKLRGIEKEAAL